MAKTQYVESCEKCPFARPFGSYAPVEWICGCQGAPKGSEGFVASCASGWWYRTHPVFCPLRKGMSFKVSRFVEVGK